MGTITLSDSPHPHKSPHDDLFHSGLVTVTDTLVIDLGLRHNTFVVTVSFYKDADMTGGPTVRWRHNDDNPGTFTIECFEAGVASATPRTVSFFVLAGASEEPGLPPNV